MKISQGRVSYDQIVKNTSARKMPTFVKVMETFSCAIGTKEHVDECEEGRTKSWKEDDKWRTREKDGKWGNRKRMENPSVE